MSIIVLTGFSGVGKSTVFKEILRHKPHWDFAIDSDQELARPLGGIHHLGSWIESVGWESFRQKEKALLESYFAKSGDGLIALGGGAFSAEYVTNKDLRFYWLDLPFEKIWERLLTPSAHRPLINLGKNKIFELYSERTAVWQKYLSYTRIDASGSPEEIAKIILEMHR